MDRKKKTTRLSQKNKITVLGLSIIIVAMIIEVIILSFLNTRNANNTSTLLLNQVVKILAENSASEKAMVESLKEDYIGYAKTVAYILDDNLKAQKDITELKKIAELMHIDEIHLFDESGSIYFGTEPKYFGYSFDSGEQMAYFKPMLEDKTLSMCQDVTPNTAENKSMMYAITWNEAGDKMIQVGIEPVRLLEELKANEITEVINNMPYYKGITIIIADEESKEIIASTDDLLEGKLLTEAGFNIENISTSSQTYFSGRSGGFRTLNVGRKVEDKLIIVSYATRSNLDSFLAACVIELVYLIIAGLIIRQMLGILLATTDEKNNQLAILSSMADIYYSMHLIDLKKNSVREYSAQNEVKIVVDHEYGADEMMASIMKTVITDEYKEQALEFFDVKSLPDRMKNKKLISGEFVGKRLGWFMGSFITIEADDDGVPTKVMCVSRSIDDIKKKEEILIARSNTDELTGLYNRRAYEDDIQLYSSEEVEENFVYISMDLNGLKVVNDTLGHAAGDELIVGACDCMKRCIGPYGKLYRTGGDEFVAIIFADENQLEGIKKDFEEVTANWTGVYNSGLTVSCGYVSKREAGSLSVRDMSLLADKKMYAAKSEFYQKKGVDRRGQKEAHITLCAQYSKILKANITEDTYQIISIDSKEDIKEIPDSISKWMKEYAMAGNVHEEDLEEYLKKTDATYLKEYFMNNNHPLYVFYRRLFDGVYKKTIMEIIPAGDYAKDNQTLFIYVKNLEE